MAYVYRHIRLDKNIPFYIGIGNDNKGKYARAYHGEKSRRCSRIWKRIVAKTTYEVEIILDDISWEDACNKEIEFILLYGRIDRETGTLANMTDGGEGVLGLIQTPESIKKSVEKRRGRIQSTEERAKRCIAMKKRGKLSDETKKRMSLAMKGRKFSEKTRNKISNTLKERNKLLGKIQISKPQYASKEEAEINRRLKISEKLKGKPKSWFGIKISDEKKQKLRENCKTKKAVIQYDLNMNYISQYASQREAGLVLGIAKESIGRACKGKSRFSTYKGFIWKYKNDL